MNLVGSKNHHEMIISLPRGNKRGLLKYKEEAARLVKERLEFYNKTYNLLGRTPNDVSRDTIPLNRLNRITIRNTKSRWGSCSKKGNLNFNYRIVFLPPDLADYLVVHELCHLGEFNHSEKFWKLVSMAILDYKERRKELKDWPHSKGRYRAA